MNLEDDILIEKFLKNELSEEEKQSFLERLSSDTPLKEQVELERQLMNALNEDSWNFLEETNTSEVDEYEALFKSEETEQLKRAIQEASEAHKKPGSSSKN